MQKQEQNNQSSPLQYLSCLQQQFPVRGAVVVGAGTGSGAWMDIFQNQGEKVLLVECDPERARSLEGIIASRDNWSIEQQALAQQEQESTFYSLSLRGESGFLSADKLRDLWPNIRTVDEANVSCTTLNGLCNQQGLHPNWIVVDCLPALTILRGANEILPEMDVLVIRRSVGVSSPDDAEMLEDYLNEKGFVRLGFEPERNPALGHAVYVRDYLSITRDFKKNLHRQIQRTEQVETENKKLQTQLHTASVELSDVYTQCCEVKEQFKVQIHKKDQELDQKTQQLEASCRDSAELNQQLHTETHERENLQDKLNEKLKSEEAAQAEATKWKEAHDRLVHQRDALKRELEESRNELEKAHNANEQKAQTLDQKTQQLEASVKESAELKQQLEARIKDREDLQGQLNEKIKAEEAALAEAAKCKEAHAGLVQERDEIKREFAKLQEQFSHLKQHKKTADEKASEEQYKLNSKISNLKHNIDKLSKENADLKKKQEEESHRHQAIEQELDRAEQQLKMIEELVLDSPKQADPEAG